MSGTRAFRLVLAVIIAFPVLRTVPAYSWHGSGSVTTLAIDPQRPITLYAATSQTAALNSPSNTHADAASYDRIYLYWQDNSRNESGFQVYRSAELAGEFTLVGTTTADVSAGADTGLKPSTQYCYKVRAFKTSGSRATYSDFSNTACATTLALPPPPAPGSIQITTATTGSYLDPDGYLVRLDGGPDQLIGTNATITIAGVAAGDHAVWLGHVAINCSVSGSNPRQVSVPAGATADLNFAVTCGPGNSIQVTAVTTGVNLDPDGYGVWLWLRSLDGWSRIGAGEGTVAANGIVTFYGLRTGEYEVEFSGVATNCDPTSPNPLPVDLSYGGAVAAEFDVTCTPPTQLAFASAVDGNPEIYIINSNGTGATRLTMDPASDVEPAWSPDGRRIAFRSDRDGNSEIYVINADGSAPMRLTSDPAADYSPAWSPDGTRIAFVSDRGVGYPRIYVMNADGSNPVPLTDGGDIDPAWSPDGSKIAFNKGGAIYVMNADGSGVTRLTSDPWVIDSQPAWWPNGAWLAISRWWCSEWCVQTIWIMSAADGSAGAVTALNPECESHGDPTWSPDGSKIAFVVADYCSGVSDAVHVIRLNATESYTSGTPLTVGSNPDWRR